MVDRQKALLMVLLALLIYPNDIFGGAFQPEFSGPITNLTVPLGRDATFTCLVKHLGGYRVGWVKADTKAIQAIHDHVITHNQRVSVSHSDHSMWNLHIKGVQKEDGGLYMCQINTDPMKSQTGMLSIVVPPDFDPEATSSDMMVGEGGQVKLTCRARGVPEPRVSWRREDGRNIIIREPFPGSTPNQKSHAYNMNEFMGEELKLTKISRNEMGVYLCIASNGIPPAVSKRIYINVHFSPVIHVPNQLVGAPLGTDVVLECFVEASPMSINYWVKDPKGAMIITSVRYDVQAVPKSPFEVRMILTIRNLQKQDVGTYRCAAKNSLGEVESSIRLYEISGPTRTQTAWPTFYDEEDEVVYGSAEMDRTENRPLAVDNTVHGHVGYPSLVTPSSTIRVGKKRPAINAKSGADSHRRRLSITDVLSPLVSLTIVCRRWWWWWW
ncbi:Lachesin [Formica fusca]